MVLSKVIKSPCQSCTKRCVGCHTACDDYKIYKQRLEDAREKEKAEAATSDFAYSVKKAVRKQAERYKKA